MPTRELLLAQALDACIRAERRRPGAAREIIAHQPSWARVDLQRLLGLAGSLDAVATNAVMSEEFRVQARARLMRRIGASASANGVLVALGHLSTMPSTNGRHHAAPPSRPRWLWRGGAALAAAAMAVTATLTVSASALPGEPLYSLKQAREEIGVRLAPDDQARTLALLLRADARLDETTRLLQQGRTDEALITTQRYDQVLERATATYVVTIDEAQPDSAATTHIETRLSHQQEQLLALLESAPDVALADLREALVATERGRALLTDPRSVERALGRVNGSRSTVVAIAPTVAVEDLAAVAPTGKPTEVAQPTLAPRPLVIKPDDRPPQARDEPAATVHAPTVNSSGRSRGSVPQAEPATVTTREDHGEPGQRAERHDAGDVANARPSVSLTARDDASDQLADDAEERSPPQVAVRPTVGMGARGGPVALNKPGEARGSSPPHGNGRTDGGPAPADDERETTPPPALARHSPPSDEGEAPSDARQSRPSDAREGPADARETASDAREAPESDARTAERERAPETAGEARAAEPPASASKPKTQDSSTRAHAEDRTEAESPPARTQAEDASARTPAEDASARTSAENAPSRAKAEHPPARAQADNPPARAQADIPPARAQGENTPTRTKTTETPTQAKGDETPTPASSSATPRGGDRDKQAAPAGNGRGN